MHWFTLVNIIFQVRFVRVLLSIFLFFEEIEVNLEFMFTGPLRIRATGKDTEEGNHRSTLLRISS